MNDEYLWVSKKATALLDVAICERSNFGRESRETGRFIELTDDELDGNLRSAFEALTADSPRITVLREKLFGLKRDAYLLMLPQYMDTGEDPPAEKRLQFPIKIYVEYDGLRLIMGEPPGKEDRGAPNIVMERHADKWLLIVHADADCELCAIKLSDDGTAGAGGFFGGFVEQEGRCVKLRVDHSRKRRNSSAG